MVGRALAWLVVARWESFDSTTGEVFGRHRSRRMAAFTAWVIGGDYNRVGEGWL